MINAKNNEIVILKIVTGDVVMGRFDEDNSTETETCILKPMTLMLDPMQGGVGMMPYDAVFSQKELDSIVFKNNFIVNTIDVHESFEEAYIKQTTGIDTSKPSLEI